jgi:hypothetical protein
MLGNDRGTSRYTPAIVVQRLFTQRPLLGKVHFTQQMNGVVCAVPVEVLQPRTNTLRNDS